MEDSIGLICIEIRSDIRPTSAVFNCKERASNWRLKNNIIAPIMTEVRRMFTISFFAVYSLFTNLLIRIYKKTQAAPRIK